MIAPLFAVPVLMKITLTFASRESLAVLLDQEIFTKEFPCVKDRLILY